MRLRAAVAALLSLVLAAARASAAIPAGWTQPFPPFHIAGNLYYVGSQDLASYLIVTPAGDILINSSLQASVPLIRKSIEQLGFKFSDIKILLLSHAHFDHDAGSADLIRLTGAKYMVMQPDVSVVETGGRTDFHYGKDPAQWYPRAHVDRVLHDGDRVELGGTVLVAHLTAGHTMGCTTWTMQVTDHGELENVVIVGSPNVNPGYQLVNNPRFPGIAEAYARTFRVLASLPCDIFLGAHGEYFGMDAKYARLKAGAPDPFVDPEGYKAFVQNRKSKFETDLATQRAAAH